VFECLMGGEPDAARRRVHVGAKMFFGMVTRDGRTFPRFRLLDDSNR